MERAAGIDPASSAWKAEVLPLNYARSTQPPKVVKPKASRLPAAHRSRDRAYPAQPPCSTHKTLPKQRQLLSLVEGGGFEPPKLARQIYSLIPLATREPLQKGAHFLDVKEGCQH